MANQGLDRRIMLEMLAKAAAASQFPGFCLWAFGADHEHEHTSPAQTPPNHQPYSPMYFNAHEYRTIEILTDLIIPANETPGAKQAGVSEFIDFMAAHGEQEIRQPMRTGLASLDALAKAKGGTDFDRLSADQQTAILKTMSKDQDRSFFLLIRRYTTLGYYTSRVGLAELDFPGLRLYAKSPACPHTNDPEHRHLSTPKA